MLVFVLFLVKYLGPPVFLAGFWRRRQREGERVQRGGFSPFLKGGGGAMNFDCEEEGSDKTEWESEYCVSRKINKIISPS